jgi:hypothetical protein
VPDFGCDNAKGYPSLQEETSAPVAKHPTSTPRADATSSEDKTMRGGGRRRRKSSSDLRRTVRPIHAPFTPRTKSAASADGRG